MPLLTAVSSGLNNHIIRMGYLRSVTGHTLRSWTKEDVMPNIFYMKDGNIVDSMFEGILFEADRAMNEESLSGKAIGFGKPPTMEAWQQSVDALFQKDHNLSIALELSTLRSQEKGLDLWVALPYPFETKQDFGLYQQRQLNFLANPLDRELALKWWIDQVLAGWVRITSAISGYNARLCGFVWTKNSLGAHDESLIQSISQYIHGKNMKLMWCQNYGTAKAWEGYQLGFDYVMARPLFTNQDPRGVDWIRSTVKFCNKFHCGMIVWGDPRVSANQLTDFLNVGRSLFKHSFQVFEIGEGGVEHLYQAADPLYDTLYTYLQES